MPGNAFINFGADVPEGESLQKTHPGSSGWIEIDSWNWEIEAEHSTAKGQGAAVGKATPGVLSISHYFDNSSPTLLAKMVAGKHFPLITIEMLKSTGDPNKDGEPEVYFQAKVTEAFVTKVATKAGEDGTMDQDVEFVFKEIAISYKPQDNLGVLQTAIPFEWSVKTNTLKSEIKEKLA
jgi:type VI secretion system secreted protein Hcp